VIIRRLGHAEYVPTWEAMRAFTAGRTAETADEIWLCEHPPVFTLGLAGKTEHLLRDIGVPVVKVDRGGQVTYHGPGQVLAYLLFDLKRAGVTVKGLVARMEQAVIELLAEEGVAAERLAGAPGVYVAGGKIAALGLKVRNGCCYHGLALNVDMDLSPFAAINPCGYEGLRVIQLRELRPGVDAQQIGERLTAHLDKALHS
jgi:lipoyl(octanoyl) transferase